MPREFQQDGDLAFGGFNSFPNSSSFDPNKGILESSVNMRIDAGVMRPRFGWQLAFENPFGGVPIEYAASSVGLKDYIHCFATDAAGLVTVRSYCTSDGTTSYTQQTSPAARAYLKVAGQGYATLGSIESAKATAWAGTYNYTSCCNVVGRMAYAKGDQIWFSLFGGIQPYDPDTISLTLGTYDEIHKLHYSNVTRKLYAFCDAGIYEIEPALSSMSLESGKPNSDFFHKIKLLSAQEGIAAADSVGETNGTIMWLNNGGINKIDLGKGMIEGELPITMPVHDIFGGRTHTELANSVGLGLGGRYYLAYPSVGSSVNDNVLVVNTALAGIFESIDRYPLGIKYMMKSRDATGVPRIYVVATDSKIYKLDESVTDNGTAIEASFRTRNYNFKTDLDKRYDAVTVNMDTKGATNTEIKFISVNPDSSEVIDKVTTDVGSTVRRALAGKKSSGAKIEVVVKSGRPYFYSVSIDASVAGRSIFSVF